MLLRDASSWTSAPRQALPIEKTIDKAFGSSDLCEHILVQLKSDPYSIRWMNTTRMFLDDSEVLRPENLVQLGSAEKPATSSIFLDTVSPSNPCTTPEPTPRGAYYCDPTTDTWYAPGNVTTNETIIIYGPTIIQGNLTFGGNIITLFGNRSSLIIESCMTSEGNKTLTVGFTPDSGDDVTGRLKQLIAANCSNVDLSNSILILKSPPNKKRCETIEFTKSSASTPTSLSGILNMTQSNCNLWWIVLISVIAGVLVLVLVTIVLLATFNKRCKQCIRPFWARSQAKNSANIK